MLEKFTTKIVGTAGSPRSSLCLCLTQLLENIKTEITTVTDKYLVQAKFAKSVKGRNKGTHVDESLDNAVAKSRFLRHALQKLQQGRLVGYGTLVQFLFSMSPVLHGGLLAFYVKVCTSTVREDRCSHVVFSSSFS
jgi:hypothetical protein